MNRIGSIISENNKTFYDYRSGATRSIAPRILGTILLSVLVEFFLSAQLGDLLAGVITVQSILIGFSFSVMFFLLSADGLGGDELSESLERQVKRRKLKRLSDEIFHNVSYFNLVAMACLGASLILLFPEAEKTIISHRYIIEYFSNEERLVISSIACGIDSAVRVAFYFLFVESGYTFSRVVGRVNYLFQEKISFRGAQ